LKSFNREKKGSEKKREEKGSMRDEEERENSNVALFSPPPLTLFPIYSPYHRRGGENLILTIIFGTFFLLILQLQ
jgi:hypothetical protein